MEIKEFKSVMSDVKYVLSLTYSGFRMWEKKKKKKSPPGYKSIGIIQAEKKEGKTIFEKINRASDLYVSVK